MRRRDILQLLGAATLLPSRAAAQNNEGVGPPTNSLVPGFPTADTTGVRPGITLTNYTGPLTITEDGTVIENKIINGTLTVTGDNVTIRNCVIQNFGYYGIDTFGASGTRIEFCDIIGQGPAATIGQSGMAGSGIVLNSDIRGVVIGINNLYTGVARHNYIHDLSTGVANPHYDGIAVFSGGNTEIAHNTISVPPGTATVFISAQFGNISNVYVHHNLLYGHPGTTGPSYTVYSEETRGYQIDGVRFEHNYIEKGQYGWFNIVGNTPTQIGNVLWEEGVDPRPTGNEIKLPF